MTASLPVRRRIRLDSSTYEMDGAVFAITVGTDPRRDVFSDIGFGLECIDILRELGRTHGNAVHAYCLMPDHVHLLIETLARSPVPAFVGRWKSRCYRARRARGEPAKFWQRSFFDHALRGENDLVRAARYIVENPVRAGLVGRAVEYPLSGSFGLEL